MNTTNAVAVARHLYETRGPQAIAEAAQNAARFREAGNEEEAKHWERVELALRELRGPRQS